ncbi:tRNA pseudouridine(38-40) synthase TruA [Metabacillus iocasae]|uniref:tRNA pseudouridine synthase A n=1 Tax=Priestia iocasae TaxID=2291674 RepID=A0ABS2R1I4_9BACI|nr:tRNA pseudouridine(38-40) synthase TruA [Metabacillus iocasae]MBM7705112.1 tRNA pseudouridine38-40 synthase [Metabacillus iocasae]
MKRIKCVISYDGSGFSGYQIQPNKRTVQGEFEGVLVKMHGGNEIKVHASGRTDANVHAYGQVLHFDTSLAIPSTKWIKALNSLLPDDIAVSHVQQEDKDFHARFSVVSKEYRYKISRQQERDVFSRDYAYHFPYELNIERMREAAQYLLGTHDFTSFCSAKTEIEDRIRTIYEIELFQYNNELTMRFVGNGFLYNMVRILVGTLIEVGQEKIFPAQIKEILEKKSRIYAGKTAPAHGLYLWQVNYDN